MSANKPSKLLTDLFKADDLPRELSIPEQKEVLKILRSGLLRPYPDVTVDYEELPSPREAMYPKFYRTRWTLTIHKSIVIQVVSIRYNINISVPPHPVQNYIDATLVQRVSIPSIEELLQ